MAKARGTTTRRPSSGKAKETPNRLEKYVEKRDFTATPEPQPKDEARAEAPLESSHPRRAAVKKSTGEVTAAPIFVVQKHDARRLHYDFRLALGDVLVSWAVPKGPSYDPKVKRLAVHVEDHPLDYASFAGRIPAGQCGAGEVEIWDQGTYELGNRDFDLPAMLAKGHVHVVLHGARMRGGWHLVRTRDEKTWLFFKADDAYANAHFDVLASTSSTAAGIDADAPRPTGDARALVKGMGDVARAVSSRLLGPPSEYLFEIKYDGYRILGGKVGGGVRLVSRNGLDWTDRFPEIARAVARLPARELVLDGEACVVDESGRPSFEALQRHLSGEKDVGRLAFPAFDLLWLDGRDLRNLPIEERRAKLEALVRGADAPLTFSTAIQGELHAVLEAARTAGLEGLVAKRRGSTYVSGPTNAWIKMKFELRQDCVVCGYTPMSGTHVAGALVLGLYDARGRFVYAGRVGTGLSDALRVDFQKRLDRAAVDRCPFEEDPRIPDVHWSRPEICIEIGLREWTRDGSPRFPRFLGFREDKSARECVRESTESFVDMSRAPRGTRRSRERERGDEADHASAIPEAPERARPATVVPLTNADKVLYPKDGITKRDIFRYYTDIATVMLPHLRGRPINMQRWPDGIHEEEWFQHNAPPRAPPYVRQVPFDRDEASAVEKNARQKWRIIVENVETLQYLANLAALTLHQRSSHLPPNATSDEAIARALATPDYVVIDLDPGEGPFSDLIRVALAVRKLLEALELESCVKTSGKRGLHVLVPLAPGYAHDDAIVFASEVARAVAKVLPDIATTEMRKDRRRGRLYVDVAQNGRGRSIVAPYSLRALDGAPVSTPIDWSEVHDGLDPSAFNLRTMLARVDARGDLLAPVLSGRGILPRVGGSKPQGDPSP